MKFKINVRSLWELGQRKRQEDSLFPPHKKCNEEDRLFIVCDGMGGHDAGDVASRTVCSAMGSFIIKNVPDSEGSFSDEDFLNALSWAYDALDDNDNGAVKKMGTTLTFLKLHDNGCTVAHIGDSRIYHIRSGATAEETTILYQTEDHSLVNDLVKLGELTPEEAKTSSQRNIITRAMQPGEERRCKADIHHIYDIEAGDYFMLCSDGILENIEDNNLQYIFSEKVGDIDQKVDMLKKVTANNSDNHTAILIKIEEVSGTVEYQPIIEVQHDEDVHEEINTDDDTLEPSHSYKDDRQEDDNHPMPDVHKHNEDSIWNKWIQPVLIAGIILLALYLIADTFLLDKEKPVKESQEQIDTKQPDMPSVRKPGNRPQPAKPSKPTKPAAVQQTPAQQSAAQTATDSAESEVVDSSQSATPNKPDTDEGTVQQTPAQQPAAQDVTESEDEAVPDSDQSATPDKPEGNEEEAQVEPESDEGEVVDSDQSIVESDSQKINDATNNK